MGEAAQDDRQATRHGRPWGLLPPALLVCGLVLFLVLGLGDSLSFTALRAHRRELVAFVAEDGLLAGLLYLALYILTVAFSLPGAVVLTVAAGFLFGVPVATLIAVLGATTGAVIVFLATRSALAGLLRRRAGPWLSRLEAGFRRDAFRYLLTLRLIPLVPFWLVNLIPGLLGMRVGAFVVATALGILPGTVVFAGIGAGLGESLDKGEPDLGHLVTPALLLPLLGLALIVVAPVLYRLVRSRRPRPS